MIEITRAEEKALAAIGQLYLEFIKFHEDIDPIVESDDTQFQV